MDQYPPDILQLQRSIHYFDLNKCKLLASWLAEHIQAMEIDERHYKVSVRQLHLSARATNVLLMNDIFTIGDLLSKSVNWDEIRVLKGAGDKVLGELKQIVKELRKN